ncbi:MAG: M48 family metallopeptidase [Alistipes sp.]|nr:M48 family metallopeptidase [Alistipes sp.]
MKQITTDIISVPVEIIRSSRRTLGIQVTKDGRIVARAPIKMPEKTIRELLNSKADWIEKHLRKAQEAEHMLEELKPFTNDELRQMAVRALKIIPERVKHYAPLIGVTYGRITIRSQKTRWGSCSGKGNLSFNCLLVMTPADVLDSVVVHELCHRRHMDHSKDFYAEVYRVFPEYDKCSKWLKENGSLLIRRMIGG